MTPDSLIGIDASRSYRSPMSGTERYSRRLVEQLLALDANGSRYRLYFNDPPPTNAPLGNAEIRTIPARRFWTHYRLSRELRENPVDILFVPSHVLPLIHPRKSIVTIHDLGYLHEPGSHTRASRIQLRLTTQWNARKAKHLIAISESTRQDLIEHCQVDPARVSVIRHGVEPAFRELDESEVRRYRIAARLPERFVLYLGTIQPRKNLVRLIDAFEQIAHDDLEVELVLAGRHGWLAEPIRQHASASHFRDRIRFLGHVPDEQLPLLYNAATCVALPSLYEGFGLPALEAQACGVPALVSNRGALPELAGADMVIADPERTDEIAAGLVTLCRQRHVREQIDRRIEHAAEFSWVNSAAQTRQLFEEVLEE